MMTEVPPHWSRPHSPTRWFFDESNLCPTLTSPGLFQSSLTLCSIALTSSGSSTDTALTSIIVSDYTISIAKTGCRRLQLGSLQRWRLLKDILRGLFVHDSAGAYQRLAGAPNTSPVVTVSHVVARRCRSRNVVGCPSLSGPSAAVCLYYLPIVLLYWQCGPKVGPISARWDRVVPEDSYPV